MRRKSGNFPFRLHVVGAQDKRTDVLAQMSGLVKATSMNVKSNRMKIDPRTGVYDIYLNGTSPDRLHFADFIELLERQDWTSSVATLIPYKQKLFMMSALIAAFATSAGIAAQPASAQFPVKTVRLVIGAALLMAGARPRIREAQPSLPADMPVALRAGELPAGVYVNLLLRVEGGTAESRLELGCSNVQADRVTLRPGSESDRVKLQTMQAGSMFLALDAGRWPAGCQLTATIDAGESGKSKPFDLGRVVRLPVIERFRLTDEPAGDGMYFGVLTGRDLELIGKTGWDAQDGQEVAGLPAPVAGGGDKQSLKVKLTWPSPAPHAPLYLWFRGEKEAVSYTHLTLPTNREV